MAGKKVKTGRVSVVGNSVIVRTVTYHYTGRIVYCDDAVMVLSDAAWIADSGRWNNALVSGSLSEVEPYPDLVEIRIQSIVDVTTWQHELPRSVS